MAWTAGIGDTVERQTGISADKACGIAQCGVGGVKMGRAVSAARVACPRKYSASAVATVRESGSEMPATAASICPAQRQCTSTAWECAGSHLSPSSISHQVATLAAIVLLLLGTGICGYRLRLCRTYKGRVYWRCFQGGYRSLVDLDIRKNCHPCKKLCRSDGKRISFCI